MLSAAIPLTGERPTVPVLAWGGFAGLMIGFAYITYFRGLTIGNMGIVATLAAVWSAIVPMVIGVALGERPTPMTWLGIVVIVVAIPLITYSRRASVDSRGWVTKEPAELDRRSVGRIAFDAVVGGAVAQLRISGVLEGTLAGIGFGLFFVALGQAGGGGGMQVWPLLAASAGAAVVSGVAATLQRVAWKAALAQWPAVIGAGVTYAAGSWAFITAAGLGWISIPAVVAALSPAPTMVLAWLLLGETLRIRQVYGIGAALVGIALVTLGLPQ
jgi:drug/metabolite transporter (DMT)-like permease